VCFWITEERRGIVDLNIIASPERKLDESLAAVIVGKLDTKPHLAARKLAQSLGIAAYPVCGYLTEAWG
jgi:hypothetical protein